MTYVDVFVAAVPNKNKDAYIAKASQMADLFKANGAISYQENWGDMVPPGKTTSFPIAVQCKDDETVVVGWAIWPSKEVHDAGMAKVMQDPMMQAGGEMPFDGSRMIFGSFAQIV